MEIADASHGVPIEHADKINAFLLEHLDRSERQGNGQSRV
jgi:hypothetical protein